MSNHKTGEWLDCTLAAKPTSKKAKHSCATVTVTFAVEGDDCPSREVADRLVNAPALLDMTEKRLAEVEAERDALRSEVAAQVAMCPDCGEVETCDEDRCCASCGRDLLVFADRYSAELYRDGERARDDERDQLRSQVTEASQVLASSLYGEERSGEQAHLPTLARMMVDALTLETVASEQARMQLDSGEDVDAATRRYLGEALGIAPPGDTLPSLSDFYDAVVEARDERDTLRLRIAEVGEVLASDADEVALRLAVARLVYESRDMGGER